MSLGEAALIAGVIQSPAPHSPFAHPERAIERRDVVLRAMADEDYVSPEAADRAAREPLQMVAGAVDNEAPYIRGHGRRTAGGGLSRPDRGDWTRRCLHHAGPEICNAPPSTPCVTVSPMSTGCSPGVTDRNPAQAALIAVDPRNGEILAMSRGAFVQPVAVQPCEVAARRQPGSVFKPFVFLAAFEYAAEEGRTDLTPASLTIDEPATFVFDNQIWEPRNFDAYDGEITWRRALAMSRNLGTIRVG